MIVLTENIIQDGTEFDKFILEAVASLIPDKIKIKLGKRSVRRKMLDKYGDGAFLQPEKLKYPIVDPDTGKQHAGLTKAAYIRARQHGKGDIAAKARDKMHEHVEYLVHLEGHDQPYDIEVLLDVIDVPPPPVKDSDPVEEFRDEDGTLLIVTGDCIKCTDDSGETHQGKVIEINGEFAVVEKSDGETKTVKV